MDDVSITWKERAKHVASPDTTMLRWLWLSGLVVALDQLSKIWVSGSLAMYETIPVVPMFNITLAHNTGAAFSFLAHADGWQRWFFVAIAIVVSVAIVIWLTRLQSEQKWVAVALALVLGGALGNLWDRVYLGYVVDFLDVYYNQWHWPAFNIADSAICVGAVILVWDSIFSNEHNRKPS